LRRRPRPCPCSSNVRASRARATVWIARAQADRWNPFPDCRASFDVLCAYDVATALRRMQA
jgi:hypothetical protein